MMIFIFLFSKRKSECIADNFILAYNMRKIEKNTNSFAETKDLLNHLILVNYNLVEIYAVVIP